MANDSSTGGYIQPVGTVAPITDDDLEDVFQAMVVGVTGLPADLVRPRWQPKPPKSPAPEIDWCAVGIATQTPDANAAIVHKGAGDGESEYQRHPLIEVLASFYGPRGMQYAQTLQDGLQIAQNIEAVKKQGISFIGSGTIRSAPELRNNQWIKRFDIPLDFKRQIKRTYPILNILSAPVSIVRG